MTDVLDKYFKDIDFLVKGDERSNNYMVAMHEAFYEFASKYVENKIVLDAGCGSAFGSSVLSRKGKKVIGIDIKPDLIDWARNRYTDKNLNLQCMDCTNMEFPDEYFDIIVCNELLEHLENYKEFLREVTRTLKNGGIFLCATVNSKYTFKKRDGSPRNKFHYQEFNIEDFSELLSVYFQKIEILGEKANSEFQHFMTHKPSRIIESIISKIKIKERIPVKYRRIVRELLSGKKVKRILSKDFFISSNSIDEGIYLVGVCRNVKKCLKNE